MRTHGRPFALLEGFARRLYRLVHIGLAALGDKGQHVLVGGVQGLEGLTGFRRRPFAAYEQLLRPLEEVQSRTRLDSSRLFFDWRNCCCHCTFSLSNYS